MAGRQQRVHSGTPESLSIKARHPPLRIAPFVQFRPSDYAHAVMARIDQDAGHDGVDARCRSFKELHEMVGRGDQQSGHVQLCIARDRHDLDIVENLGAIAWLDRLATYINQ